MTRLDRHRLRAERAVVALQAGMVVPRFHSTFMAIPALSAEVVDRVGVDLPDISFARREAIRFAGQLFEERATQDELGPSWRIQVADARELILFMIDFSVTLAPVISERYREP